MGKQKVVIGISMKDQKARTKAFKIAVSVSGVESASIQAEKGQLEVVGDVDAVDLASQLRKRLGQADIVSVGSAEKKEEKKEEKKDDAPKPQSMIFTTYDPCNNHYALPYPAYSVYPIQDYNQSGCSIM